MADKELRGSPSMLPLFARASLAIIPGASQLPLVGGGGGEVPDQALTRADVAVDRDRLAAYDRVCGFDLSDTLPPTYPHMLAFPLHLALMTDGRFPLPAIGLVHIANAITVHRPLRAAERLSLRVWATPARAPPARAPVHHPHRGAGRRRARVGGGLDEPQPRQERGRGRRRGSAPDDPLQRRPARRPPPGAARATSGAATARSRAT